MSPVACAWMASIAVERRVAAGYVVARASSLQAGRRRRRPRDTRITFGHKSGRRPLLYPKSYRACNRCSHWFCATHRTSLVIHRSVYSTLGKVLATSQEPFRFFISGVSSVSWDRVSWTGAHHLAAAKVQEESRPTRRASVPSLESSERCACRVARPRAHRARGSSRCARSPTFKARKTPGRCSALRRKAPPQPCSALRRSARGHSATRRPHARPTACTRCEWPIPRVTAGGAGRWRQSSTARRSL